MPASRRSTLTFSVQSLQIDLGSNTAIYNYVYSNIYLIDPSTGKVFASEPLNSSTVVQSCNDYIVGLAGFNFIVPKGTYKDLQVAVDLQSTILSNYLSDCSGVSCATEQLSGLASGGNVTPWTVAIQSNSIRAVDGAGVDDYGPSTVLSQSMVVSQNQTLSASASVSLDSASPLVSSVPVTNLTQGSYLGLPIMIFDINAQGDNLHIHNATVQINANGPGTIGAAYLYQGSTPIMSGAVTAVSGGTNHAYQVTFPNIPDGTAGASIPINTSVPFTIKVDVSGLTSNGATEMVSATTTGMTVYNSSDSSITPSGVSSTGTAGNYITVLGQGLNFSLSGTPTIAKAISTQNTTTGSTTYSYTANFNVVATAVGENVSFGLPNAVQPSFGTSSTGLNLVQVYQDGAPVNYTGANPDNTGILKPTVIAAYSAPSNTTMDSLGQNFTLGQNQSVTIPVSYSFTITDPGAHTYSVQIQGISTSVGTSTFMAGQTQWRSAVI